MRNNVTMVQNAIKESCKRVNRSADEVMLVAVSKTKPVPMLEEVYETGIREFGENKVQELCEKYEVLPKDIHWHMIGHLQRNKVKYIIDKVVLIHSVDSFRLAEEIEKQAAKHEIHMNILIEVNIAEEETKFGIKAEELESLIREIAVLPHVHIRGLMTSAPYVVDSEENRGFFHKIKQLAVDIERKNIDNVSMNILSMGMSGDYQVAIEEGATVVRVGTGIFGKRDYKIG